VKTEPLLYRRELRQTGISVIAATKNYRLILIAILALSVLLRVGVAFYLGDVVDAPPLLTDQRSYDALAARLISGHGFSFAEPWYPFTPPDTPTAHWSFLEALFVAAVYAVAGVHPLAARLAHAVLGGILLPWMVYRLSRRLFSPSPSEERGLGGCAASRKRSERDEVLPSPWPAVFPSPSEERGSGGEVSPFPRAAVSPSPCEERGPGGEVLPLLSALLAAVYFYFMLYAATLMTETFYIVALLWSLERAMALAEATRSREPARRWAWLALQLGLALGIATLFRQSALPWVAVLFAWLLWANVRAFRRLNTRTLASLVIAGLALVACILPFTLRNERAYGTFLLLNSNAGYAMYAAQHPMHGTSFREFDAAPLPADLKGRNEAEWDRDLMRRGIGFVVAEPGRYLLLSLSRVGDYFEFWPSPGTTLLHNIGRVGSFGLFLPFMLYGIWLAVRRARAGPPPQGWGEIAASPLGLALLFMAFYSLLHILTWAMPRYRLPVDAVALPFAALAIVGLARRIPAVGRWERAHASR
jgi:hypothetical protein